MSTSTFVNHPYWLPDYSEDISEMLLKVPIYHKRVETFIKNPDNYNYIDGYENYYHAQYITECNIGENTGTQTLGETEYCLKNTPNNRNSTKTRNLSSAVDHLFGKSLIREEIHQNLDVQLAKDLNKIIGDKLFNGGCYRTTPSKPAATDFYYLDPENISSYMEELFQTIRGKDITPKNWYEIGAYFFERFLYIHPFVNGNGRTARLLLSVLLRKFTIVPLSLYIDKNTKFRKIYLNSLEEYRLNNKLLLHSLVINCVYLTLYYFIQNLDVE